MTRRELPRAEWPRLIGTELGPALNYLPVDTAIVVVEDAAGAIVGAWAFLRYVHAEGLWIAPASRGRGRVLAHLLAGMREVVPRWGTRALLTAAITPDVRALLEHYGAVRLPGDHFVFPVERSASCLR